MLKRKGFYDNLIIIFIIDNGGVVGGLDVSVGLNYFLWGVKNILWEGGVCGVGFVYSLFFKKRGKMSFFFVLVIFYCVV